MIRYALKCSRGHQFEAWFASSAAYEREEADGRLSCPTCGATDVSRAIMAPSIATHRVERASASPAEPSSTPAPAQVPTAFAGSPDAVRLKQMIQEVRALRDKMLEKSEYVGQRFADEARSIHHEEAPDRPIHGEATPEQVSELVEDGIDILPVPRLPDDFN